jgi:hypothetical protein
MRHTYGIIMLSGCLMACLSFYALAGSDILTFRLAHDREGAGASAGWAGETEGRYDIMAKDGITYSVDKKVEFDSNDIESAKIFVTFLDFSSNEWKQRELYPGSEGLAPALADRSNHSFEVIIGFKEGAGARFEKYTRDNLGQRLAILLNGKLVSAPLIKRVISDGVVAVAGLSFEEARSIGAAIAPPRR